MKFKTFFCFVILFDWASTLTLPGSCPTLDLSSDVISKLTNYRVIGMVPFDSNPNTNVFGGVLVEACDLSVNATYLTLTKNVEAYLREVFEPDQGNLTRSDDNTYSFIPFKLPTGVPCKFCSPVIDRFRIWLTKFGAFVWSCSKLSYDDIHDQGLLVLMDKDEYIAGWFSSNLGEILTEMKSIIGNYFNETLVNAVLWEDEAGKTFCNARTLYSVLIPLYGKTKTPATTAIALYIAGILLLACFIFKLFVFKSTSGGQVVPIE